MAETMIKAYFCKEILMWRAGPLFPTTGRTSSFSMALPALRNKQDSPGLLRFSIGYTGDLDARLAALERAVREVGLA